MEKKNTKECMVIMALVAIIGGTVFANAGIIPVSGEAGPMYGGTLVWGTPFEPKYFNPNVIWNHPDDSIAGQMYEHLIRLNWNYGFEPELAQSWNISADGLRYTFNLINNCTWHDGVPFTSADVKYTYENMTMPLHPIGSAAFAAVDHIETPDNYTVVFVLKYRWAPLIWYLTQNAGCILPVHLYNGTDPYNNPTNRNPVGTGPFKFVEWVAGDHITLIRNDNYWRGKQYPYLDKIIIKIIPDATALILALQRGDIDVIGWYGFPVDQYTTLARSASLETFNLNHPAAGIVQLMINLRNAPLNNTLVRQALAYGIDNDYLNSVAVAGTGKKASAPISSAITFAYDPNLPQYGYDVDKANQLLDQANYPRGSDGIRFKLSLIYDANNRPRGKIAEYLKQAYKQIGVDLTLTPKDSAGLNDYVFTRWEFDLFLEGSGTGADPSIMVARTFISTNIRKGVVSSNCAGYNNSLIDQLFYNSGIEDNVTKRKAIFYQIQEILWADLPSIWLWEYPYPYSHSVDFVNVPGEPASYGSLYNAYWEKGSVYSPSDCSAAIAAATTKIADLQNRSYDVTSAQAKLNEAKAALAKYDYTTAKTSADLAPSLAIAPGGEPGEQGTSAPFPYEIVIAAAVIVIVIVLVASIVLLRRRKKS